MGYIADGSAFSRMVARGAGFSQLPSSVTSTVECRPPFRVSFSVAAGDQFPLLPSVVSFHHRPPTLGSSSFSLMDIMRGLEWAGHIRTTLRTIRASACERAHAQLRIAAAAAPRAPLAHLGRHARRRRGESLVAHHLQTQTSNVINP
jgi:hypothetical protein